MIFSAFISYISSELNECNDGRVLVSVNNGANENGCARTTKSEKSLIFFFCLVKNQMQVP